MTPVLDYQPPPPKPSRIRRVARALAFTSWVLVAASFAFLMLAGALPHGRHGAPTPFDPARTLLEMAQVGCNAVGLPVTLAAIICGARWVALAYILHAMGLAMIPTLSQA